MTLIQGKNSFILKSQFFGVITSLLSHKFNHKDHKDNLGSNKLSVRLLRLLRDLFKLHLLRLQILPNIAIGTWTRSFRHFSKPQKEDYLGINSKLNLLTSTVVGLI